MISPTISVPEFIYTLTSVFGVLNVWAWLFFWHRWVTIRSAPGNGDLLGLKILALEKLVRHSLKVMIQVSVFCFGVWNMTLAPINPDQPITPTGVALVAIVFFTCFPQPSSPQT